MVVRPSRGGWRLVGALTLPARELRRRLLAAGPVSEQLVGRGGRLLRRLGRRRHGASRWPLLLRPGPCGPAPCVLAGAHVGPGVPHRAVGHLAEEVAWLPERRGGAVQPVAVDGQREVRRTREALHEHFQGHEHLGQLGLGQELLAGDHRDHGARSRVRAALQHETAVPIALPLGALRDGAGVRQALRVVAGLALARHLHGSAAGPRLRCGASEPRRAPHAAASALAPAATAPALAPVAEPEAAAASAAAVGEQAAAAAAAAVVPDAAAHSDAAPAEPDQHRGQLGRHVGDHAATGPPAAAAAPAAFAAPAKVPRDDHGARAPGGRLGHRVAGRGGRGQRHGRREAWAAAED
mmetsp:Transcript_102910/g.288425  ORF Transcript_102910/g.288425 Transcript_102910/m.288425 type:complete len:352 (+) Transcript_102910:608-1663(+)